MRRANGCLLAILLVAMALFGAFQVHVYTWRIGHLPKALGVWRILYAKEKAWSFGPGGNETGVIVYQLPAAASRRLPQALGPGWRPTPVAERQSWLVENTFDGRPAKHRSGVIDYIDRYGMAFPMDPKVEAMIDEIIWTPGAYYAYRRGRGLLLVSPKAGRAVFVYAG